MDKRFLRAAGTESHEIVHAQGMMKREFATLGLPRSTIVKRSFRMYFNYTPSRFSSALRFAMIAAILLPVATSAQKLKAEDVLAKHLESIGPQVKREAVRARTFGGTCRLTALVGAGVNAVGRVELASEGRKFRIALPFEALQYWGEQFAFDGEKAQTGYVQEGVRSQWGDFVDRHDLILREGLLGGVLNTSWALLDVAGRQAKLSYDGVKKIDERELHRITYRAKKGSGDVTVYLFFDKENFRHVRTQYEELHISPMGEQPTESPQQRETRLVLTESFFNFQDVNGLTLPTRWQVRMSSEVNQRTSILEWDVTLRQGSVNDPVAADAFAVRPHGPVAAKPGRP
jgi:hypothetical protein